ncbi:hypothetical protein RQP46_001033 [Phenoliferia psychrophenolica]
MASLLASTAQLDSFVVDSPMSTPLSSPAISSSGGSPVRDPDDGLATLLRKSTGKAHQEVMQPAIVAKLVSGQLPQEIHLRYLMMLYQIYAALEDALALHSTHPLLCDVYQPALLARAPALDSDCAYYTSETAWRAKSPIWRELEDENPPSLDAYVGRLEELARNYDDDKSATLLLAHAYVRYLGDLSGGQTIARTIRKTYRLPDSGEGSSFYEFFVPATAGSTTGLPTPAGPTETKEIKAWFRRGLDAAGERMTEQERAAVIREARYAFELNIGVFASFEGAMSKWEKEQQALEGAHPPKTKTSAAASTRNAVLKTPAASLQDPNTLAWIGVGLVVVLAIAFGLRDWATVTA